MNNDKELKMSPEGGSVVGSTTCVIYKCRFCDRGYRLKENYTRHVSTCRYFHESHLFSNDERNEASEPIPTQQELYGFFKQIAIKYQRLEAEVAHLKRIIQVRERRHIMDILNAETKDKNLPSFDEWCERFVVTQDDLQEVFDGNLVYGLKAIMKPHFEEKEKSMRPIRAFRQKNQIYIYQKNTTTISTSTSRTNESAATETETETRTTEEGAEICVQLRWQRLTNHVLEKIASSLERQFLQVFLQWQRENQERISQSEKAKDEEIQYMMKICGYKLTTDYTVNTLRKWIMDTIGEDIIGIVVDYE